MVKQQHIHIAALLSLLSSGAFAQCTTVFAQDSVNTYYGYDPLACTELEPWVTGNGPFTYVWSTAATIPVITVCEPGSGWYSVTTTDADGCVASDSIFVNVVDVRCGNGLNKVAVCHIPPGNPSNAHTICISENGVPAHLAHGCSLGACAVDTADADSSAQTDVDLVVAPNPMVQDAYVQLVTSEQETVLVTLVDGMGRTRQVLFSGVVQADTPMRWPLLSTELTGQLFWVRCATDSGKRASHQVLRIE
jgi:hypothetical protein